MNSPSKLFAAALGLALTGTGCMTLPDDSAPPPASQADVGYLREELRRMQSRLDASDAEIGRLQAELASSRSAQPGYASAVQVQSMQTQIEDLHKQLRTLDAARVQDKKDLYDDIAKKVASLIRSAPPAASGGRTSRSGSQTGIEHVVQPGESLSRIASAYGVKIDVLVDVNNLKSPDNIYAGQTLFIPD